MINPAELDLKEESVIRVTRVSKVTSRGKNFRFGYSFKTDGVSMRFKARDDKTPRMWRVP